MVWSGCITASLGWSGCTTASLLLLLSLLPTYTAQGTGPSLSFPGGPGSARSLYDTIVRNIKEGHKKKAGGAGLGETTPQVRPRLPEIKQKFAPRLESTPIVPGGSHTGPGQLQSQGFHPPPQTRVSYPRQLPVLSQPPVQSSVQPPVQPFVQPPERPLVQPPVQTPVQPRVQPPVRSPVQRPIQTPRQPLVQPHVRPPVQPLVEPSVQPHVQPLGQPPVQPLVEPPVRSPVTHKSSLDVASVQPHPDLYNLIQNSILQKPSVSFATRYQQSKEISETHQRSLELPATQQKPIKFPVHQAVPSSLSVHPDLPPPVPHPRLSKLPSLFPQVRQPLQEISPVLHQTPEIPEIINISQIPAKNFQEIKETTSFESDSEYSSLPQGWSEEDQERLENRINEERLKEIEKKRSRELAARDRGQGRFSKRPQPRKN